MRAAATPTAAQPTPQPAPPDVRKLPRFWPALVLLAVFWVLHFIVAGLEKPYFYGFLYGMAAPGLLTLLYFTWWWTNRRMPLSDRLYGFVLIVGLGVATVPLCHSSVVFGLLTLGVPLVLTVWTVWLILATRLAIPRQRLVSLAIVALTWLGFTLIRIDGLTADLHANLRWRWATSSEDLFLAWRASSAGASGHVSATKQVLTAGDGDWTGYRGADRDGVVRGVTVATDWNTHPPRLLWRHRVGPAWSSVIVVGDRLFTQEQRGDRETVVCYEAPTGKEIWIHEDAARFEEGVSGAGPRATPTFADGCIFSLGATGILNCLDAATGKRHWSRDIRADAGATVPMWGLSGSPLVVDGLAIVFAGGDGQHSLRAYRADSGTLAWTAPAGTGSYSSPQLATIGGSRQCLFLGDQGLTAVDPATGTQLWQAGQALPGAPRAVQPQAIRETALAAGSLMGPGVARIDVTREGPTWKVVERWATTQMRPEFPNFVVHQGHAYGFDVSIFCCIDLARGKRCWKEGRFGRGQVLLLAEQSLLLLVSDTGEAILLKAHPERYEELGRFQALEGKTWNHPVLAHGRLFFRNAEWLACYEMRAGR